MVVLAPPVAQQRLPRLALTVMAAATFAAVTTEVLPVGLLPVISRDLHTSQGNVGLLVSAYAVIVALGSIPLAAFLVRWPRRLVLCGLLASYAVSNAVMAGSHAYAVALGARLLGGVAHAGFFAAVFGAAVSIVPEERAGDAVVFVAGGTVLALALGVPLGTALGTAAGWRWAFVACALLMSLLVALTWLTMPADAPVAAGRDATPLLTAARRRPLVLVAVFTAVLTLGHYTPYTYITLLVRRAGVGSGGVSLVLLGYGFAGLLGWALASRRLGGRAWTALARAVVLIAICLLLLALWPSAVPSVVVIGAWGLAFGALPTLIQAVALRAVPDAPDAAPAVVNAMFNVGIAGGALIGAGEISFASTPAVAVTGAVLAAVSVPLLRSARTAV